MIAQTNLTSTTTTSEQVPVIEEYESKIDKALRRKYDKVIERIDDKKEARDSLILFSGDEGSGKSNHALGFANYIAKRTGREFYNKDVYFDATELINIAKSTKRKVFLWDEPSLQGLKRQWWNQTQLHLLQLLNMARKNRHLFIFSILDFSKFSEFITNRAIFMLYIYKRKENDSIRRFMFFPRRRLRLLVSDWNKKKFRTYNKRHTIHGTMPNIYVLPFVIDENEYENAKDKAIMSIGVKPVKEKDELSRTEIKSQRLREAIWQFLHDKGHSHEEFSDYLGINSASIRQWKPFTTNYT
jgi:hypothetical protein